MTHSEWFAVARDVVMVVVTALVFYWGRDRQQTKDSIQAEFKARDREIKACLVEIVELKEDMKLLLGKMDRLPEELRIKFMPMDRALDIIDESRRDRQALWMAVRGQPGARQTDR